MFPKIKTILQNVNIQNTNVINIEHISTKQNKNPFLVTLQTVKVQWLAVLGADEGFSENCREYNQVIPIVKVS